MLIGSFTDCAHLQPTRSTSWLGWRWQPAGCASPRFDARAFLEMFRNKVVANIGDSLSFNCLFLSLICQLHRVSPVTAVAAPPPAAVAAGASLWRVAAYNFTLYNVWDTFLVASNETAAALAAYGDTSPFYEDAVINVGEVNPAWSGQLAAFDHVMLQTADHWRQTRTKRRIFVAQNWKAFNPQPYFADAFRLAMLTLRDFFDAQATAGGPHPIAFFLSAPAVAHGPCGNLLSGPANMTGFVAQEGPSLENTYYMPAQRSAFVNSSVRFLEVTTLTLYRADGHVGGGGQDCIHYCNAGVPDTWVDLWWQMLLREPTFSSRLQLSH